MNAQPASATPFLQPCERHRDRCCRRKSLELAQHDTPGIGIATIYRNLKTFMEEGAVQLVQLPGENARIRVCAASAPPSFPMPRLTRLSMWLVARVPWKGPAPNVFVVRWHELTLYGQCATAGPPRGGRKYPV